MKNTIISVAFLALFSCTDKTGAERALINAGYHPIEVGGYALFCCGQDDNFATKFKAYSPDSTRIVIGCVCKGILKKSTIRTN
jgi:hypothetical protein